MLQMCRWCVGMERQQAYTKQVAVRREKVAAAHTKAVRQPRARAPGKASRTGASAAPKPTYLDTKWKELPTWQQHVNKAKFSAYFHTQMLRHYIDHRDSGPAGFFEESLTGVLAASHLGSTLPRFIELSKAAQQLDACKTGTSAAAEATRLAKALLSASSADSSGSGEAVGAAAAQAGGGMMGQLQERMATYAAHANAARAWPDGTSLEAPYVFSPKREARAKVNPGMYTEEVETLLRNGGYVLQFIDVGETVPVRTDGSDDLVMTPIAHADLWGPVQTYFPHRVPVGDRIEGVSTLGRLIVAAVEQVVAIAGFEAIEKLKARSCSRFMCQSKCHLASKRWAPTRSGASKSRSKS